MTKLPGAGRGALLYLAAAFLWSLNGSVSKTLLAGGIEVTRLSQLRVSAAFVLLALVVSLRSPGAWRLHGWREVRLLALYGVVGLAFTQLMYFVAIWLLPVGVALVLEYTAPFLVALWIRFARGQGVPRLVWAGLAVAMVGLALITEVWSGFALNALGVAAGLGAAIGFAVYFLAGECALHAAPPRDSLSLSMWGFAFATAFWAVAAPWGDFPWAALSGESEVLPGVLTPNALLAAFMVVGGTLLPFWFALAALRYLTAAQASGFGMLEPVLASLVALGLLNERLSGWQVLGGLVTLTGVALAEVARGTKAAS